MWRICIFNNDNEVLGTPAKGIVINGVCVESFIKFFLSLFPREVDGVRCFPVLNEIDSETYWIKTRYNPSESHSINEAMIWDISGAVRTPTESEMIRLFSSIRKDRISIGYWTGTRADGKILMNTYSGIPLTKVVLPVPKTSPFFSIIMPVFNRQKTILRAMESIKKSSFSDFECIIVDDGSTDNSSRIINDAIKDDQRFAKITKHFNGGIGAALATGVLNISGRWITRCDSDDEYAHNHLESRVMRISENPGVTVIYGGMVPVNGADTLPLASGVTVNISKSAQGPTIFIRRDVLNRIGTFADMRYGEDEEFLSRAVRGNESILVVQDKTYIYYRDTVNSLTGNYPCR